MYETCTEVVPKMVFNSTSNENNARREMKCRNIEMYLHINEINILKANIISLNFDGKSVKYTMKCTICKFTAKFNYVYTFLVNTEKNNIEDDHLSPFLFKELLQQISQSHKCVV